MKRTSLLSLLSFLVAQAQHDHTHHHHHRHSVGMNYKERHDQQASSSTPSVRPHSHSRGLNNGIKHFECGFDESDVPTPEELAQEKRDQQEWSSTMRLRKQADVEISIPTYFHVLQQDDDDEIVSDERVYEYMNYLNDAFATNTRFQFRLQDITRTVNSHWSNNGRTAQYEYKSALKVGGRETLNIYICNLVPRDLNSEITLAGFAYLPTANADAILDGVVLSRTYDGDRQRPNTLVHEVGHYLGLMHTFDGDSCDDIVGDAVDDTPQHRRPDTFFNGCTSETVDTCQDIAGTDPITNFMTYSHDNECRSEFTPGQVARMEYQYYTHRQASEEIEYTDRPTMTPEKCAPFFGICDVRDCCFGNCWRGLFFGLLPDFCFL